jgi:predicted DNA-binding transcriptional regulator YafY
MLETSARLLRLLSLLELRRELSGTELADRLEVSPRTVRRDIDRLRALGYSVAATAGVAGYRLEAGQTVPPLLLDDEEAVAVAVGLRTAAGSVTGLDETSMRALAKLDRVLPAHLRRRVRTLASFTVPLVGGEPNVDGDTLVQIASACRDAEQLRLEYRDREGAVTVRDVEPHRLVHAGRRWYLIAFDRSRDAWRTLRVDRLTIMRPSGPRFSPRTPPEDVATLTSRAVAAGGYRYQARVRVAAPAAVIRSAMAPTAATVEEVDERSCVVITGSNALDEIALYVALLGVDFEVQEPPELIEAIRDLAARLTRASTPR